MVWKPLNNNSIHLCKNSGKQTNIKNQVMETSKQRNKQRSKQTNKQVRALNPYYCCFLLSVPPKLPAFSTEAFPLPPFVLAFPLSSFSGLSFLLLGWLSGSFICLNEFLSFFHMLLMLQLHADFNFNFTLIATSLPTTLSFIQLVWNRKPSLASWKRFHVLPVSHSNIVCTLCCFSNLERTSAVFSTLFLLLFQTEVIAK